MGYYILNNAGELLLHDKKDTLDEAKELAVDLTYDRAVTEGMILMECGQMIFPDDDGLPEWTPTPEYQQLADALKQLSTACTVREVRIAQLENELRELKNQNSKE